MSDNDNPFRRFALPGFPAMAPGITRRTAGAMIGAAAAAFAFPGKSHTRSGMTAHDFEFVAIDGRPLPLQQFRGKAVLLVNTASQCGFTPQYADLQKLWSDYRRKGLVVIGVPSNDFGGQEPGSAQQIKDFCEVNFDVDFPLTEKQRVIGADAHPFYRWVAQEFGEDSLPKWNFHKYLIAPDGNLAGTFPSRVKPTDPELIGAVEAALKDARI